MGAIVESIIESASDYETAKREVHALEWTSQPLVDDWAEHLLATDLYGRLTIAVQAEGVELSLLSSLSPKRIIEIAKAKGVVGARELKTLASRYERKARELVDDVRDYVKSSVGSVLDRASKLATPYVDFAKGARDVLEQVGLIGDPPYHMETVAVAIGPSSFAHGRWEESRKSDVIESHPYWRYLTAGDARVRPSHAEMDGRIWRADDEVWETWYPPSGWGCRCVVEVLGRDEVDLAEVTTEMPSCVPDEGWEGSPGGWLAD